MQWETPRAAASSRRLRLATPEHGEMPRASMTSLSGARPWTRQRAVHPARRWMCWLSQIRLLRRPQEAPALAIFGGTVGRERCPPASMESPLPHAPARRGSAWARELTQVATRFPRARCTVVGISATADMLAPALGWMRSLSVAIFCPHLFAYRNVMSRCCR